MPNPKDVVRRFVDAMNAHDMDAVAACYAPTAQIIYPGRAVQSPTEVASSERGMLESVPDYRIEAKGLFEMEGDQVLLELRMSGTQREDLGGKTFEITGAYIFRIENGQIVEERAYPDIAGLRRQLSPR